MEASQTLGFAHFINQTDAVGRVLLVALAAMSIITWYLIAVKVVTVLAARRRSRDFLDRFWRLGSRDAITAISEETGNVDCYSTLSAQAYSAARRDGRDPDFVTRTMRRVIDEHTTRLESGLTLLASIGSTAPFIGLFGTVWGVYHALVSIAASGSGTLDQVAGPVGEALIMTALGLAVAIPAVLAYNFTVRSNRMALARLNAYAHDLYALLTADASHAERRA